MSTLTVTVHPVTECLPDADLEVICFLEDGDTEPGFLDGETWRDFSGMPFDLCGQTVIAWANFPELPTC